MDKDFRKVETLYALKIAKYGGIENCDEELRNILFYEAVNEVVAAKHINKGRL